MSLLIKHGTLAFPDNLSEADLFVEGDVISAIGAHIDVHADVTVDATGKYVIPGGIDVHTHLEAPVGGTTSSDDFFTGTRAAAFGGTTSIIDFATQSKGMSLLEAYDLWRAKASKAAIDYGLHMIIADVNEDRCAELGDLVRKGVVSFKVFMAYPGTLMLDDAGILAIMRKARELGAIVAVHAEEGVIIDGLVKKALTEGRTSPIEHALTRPPETEAEAVRRAIVHARMAGVPLYIVHVTCAGARTEIAKARRLGLPVFGETCPHYLFLTKDELSRPGFEGAKFVLTPPLRGKSDQAALWEGLESGDLQVVSTDHCPFFYKTQKQAGVDDFTKIPNGGPGIENRLELLFHFGVNRGRISVSRWVDLVATNPSKLFGLYPKKGTLQIGSDADVVIWNPELRHTISASTHHMNCDYSMYEGMTVEGGAETVISRGEIIVDHDAWLGSQGRGRYLKRRPSAEAHSILLQDENP